MLTIVQNQNEIGVMRMVMTKEKVTRIMKVTLDKDEFEKFDKGVTHSDNGLRGDKGKLSALPDIAPISEDDLPNKETVRKNIVCKKCREKPLFGAQLAQVSIDIIDDVLSDPEIQESIALLIKTYWHSKMKPKILNHFKQIQDCFSQEELKATKILKNKNTNETLIFQFEVKNDQGKKIVVTEEEAQRLLFEFKEKANEFATMILILSSICVKNKKTQEEYALEKLYIRELSSEESVKTMRMLTQQKQLLDESTALCLSDFLSGYIRSGNQLVKIPVNNRISI